MPTVLRIRSFRFHFYSNEGIEPAHIHVDTPDGECKFWLNPVELARAGGLPPRVLREIQSLILENERFLLEKFHEYHGR
ncbi:DUF4160 domain-containing protein [Turneriella parva]|jgi:hypothetical protein|uniref:DUF4160 domain-containing protein n=1 Tax=Turneriella parva (strain ATCC BAA-1111 / DSM 21527 / NCTC 11395 / H) TaxID=869212 RepID=I4B267_TURPD|nr:DUF4160 domain-containing protein [Turneriella parva]AFM11374.1 hypothetical protein Turpa_0723 [Turneriella parva DSM 21527]